MKNSRVSRRKEILKIRAEINAKETKEILAKINKSKKNHKVPNKINNLILHLKQLEKEEMKNPRVSRRKEILKLREEINAKETKEIIANQQSQKLVL